MPLDISFYDEGHSGAARQTIWYLLLDEAESDLFDATGGLSELREWQHINLDEYDIAILAFLYAR